MAALLAVPIVVLEAQRLASGLGEIGWPRNPVPAVGAALAALGAMVVVGWRWRQGTRRLDPPEDAEPTVADMERALAYATIGVMFARTVGGSTSSLASIFAWPGRGALPAKWIIVIDLAVLALVTAWFWYCAWWRGSHAATVAALPSSASVQPRLPHRAFAVYVAWLFATVSAGLILLTLQSFAQAWWRHLPWTLWAAVLACALALLDTGLDWRRRPTERRDVLRLAGQTQLWAQGIAAALVLIVAKSLEALGDSAHRFAEAALADRVAFSLMPGLFFVGVAGTVLGLALTGHRVRVFISFHHGREQSASELQTALTRAGLRARRVPFRTDYQHDELLRSIQEELRRCDAMVCLPGANPSFVENEVLVASTLKKFIVFVVGEREPRLPNTAFYGYPVFRLERVCRRHWRPVADLILLVAGHWRASLRFLNDSWSRLFDDNNSRLLIGLIVAFVAGTYCSGAAVALLSGGLAGAWQFIRGFHRFYLDLLGGWLIPWGAVNAILIGSAFALLNLLRTRGMLRQETLTGHVTHDLLRERLGRSKRLHQLLGSLWKRPPAAQHETA